MCLYPEGDILNLYHKNTFAPQVDLAPPAFGVLVSFVVSVSSSYFRRQTLRRPTFAAIQMSTSGRFALRCRLEPKSLHDASKMVRLQSRTTRNDTSAAHRAQQIRQRTSRSSDEEKRRRRAISKGIRSGDKMEIFGMRPIDYSVLPPIRYTPPPPPMRKQTQVLFPATVLLTAGIVGYFYMNNVSFSSVQIDVMTCITAAQIISVEQRQPRILDGYAIWRGFEHVRRQ